MNNIKTVKGRELDRKRLVRVYRNLRRGDYSILQDGVVVARAKSVPLKFVTFTVQHAGWCRAKREGRRNVHAFAVGFLSSKPRPQHNLHAYYSLEAGVFKFEAGACCTGDDAYYAPLWCAKQAWLTPDGLFVKEPNTEPGTRGFR